MMSSPKWAFFILLFLGLCSCNRLTIPKYGFFREIVEYMKDIFTPIETPTGHISDLVPSAEEILKDSDLAEPLLHRLKSRTFFRIFKIDFSRDCPFWAEKAICSNPEDCSVCECPDNDIPSLWKQNPVQEYIDKRRTSFKEWTEPKKTPIPHSPLIKDTFFQENAVDTQKPVLSYVDLRYNRPGFTGYSGTKIWNLIYQENCFPKLHPFPIKGQEQCAEETGFYRLISGMQSNIAALSSEYSDKSNRVSLRWFRTKLGPYRERMENLYFTFSILLRTACYLSSIFDSVDFGIGEERVDRGTRGDVYTLLSYDYSSCRPQYLNNYLFYERAQQAVDQIYNTTRVLDCVSCEKCRLHGKVKLTALQLAVKAGSSDPFLQVYAIERNEIVALFNALIYFSDSLQIIRRMERRAAEQRYLVITGGVLSMVVIFMVVRKLIWCVRKRCAGVGEAKKSQ